MSDGWLYFGCHEQPGHYLWKPNGNRADYDHPLGKFDGSLCLPGTRKERIASLTRLCGHGYSALAFWDYSVDDRPGSNSIIFVRSLKISPQDIVDGARRFLPFYAKRWPSIDLSRCEYRFADPAPSAASGGR